MTKKDVKLIIALLVICGAGFLGYGIYTWYLGNQKDVSVVEVYYHSEVVAALNFDEDQIYELDGDYGHMVIEIKDQKVRVKEVECPNHTCENTGWVSKGSYLPIYCMPNDIIIKEKE